MKRFLAGLGTLALMLILLWSGSQRGPSQSANSSFDAASTGSSEPEATDPIESTIHRLHASATRGDVTTYLSLFTGTLKQRLEREVSTRGSAEFGRDLQSSAKARKSHAVFSPQLDGSDAATITVESVYADRNERQTYRLEKLSSGDWLVAAVETIRTHQPPAKYGTPAFTLPGGADQPAVGVTVESGDETDPSQ